MRAAVTLLAAVTALWWAAPASAGSVDDALYRDLGQRSGLERIVDQATRRWLADDRIKDQFDNLNILRFERRLVDQLCELTGGPCHYTGRNMYLTHKGLHISAAEFNALVEGLQDAMAALDVRFSVQNRLLVILAPMQRDIVTR